MRIFDVDNKIKLDGVDLLLTMDQIKEMRDSLEDLIENPKHHHAHISNEDYTKEITIYLYDENNLDPELWSERTIKLIKEDK